MKRSYINNDLVYVCFNFFFNCCSVAFFKISVIFCGYVLEHHLHDMEQQIIAIILSTFDIPAIQSIQITKDTRAVIIPNTIIADVAFIQSGNKTYTNSFYACVVVSVVKMIDIRGEGGTIIFFHWEGDQNIFPNSNGAKFFSHRHRGTTIFLCR